MMQIRKSKIQHLYTLIFILVGISVWVLMCEGATLASSYTDSAHGNTSYGVNRSDTGYPVGDCAHCHDPMGLDACVNELMLFVPNDSNFCLTCHDNTDTYATTPIVNRSYSHRAGGWTADPLDDILEAFTDPPSTSSHNLNDIQTFIDGKWDYTADSNPCTVCHNPDRVQGDPENSPNTAKTPATRGWPVTRPTKHGSLLSEDILWGDDTDERMSGYTASYQAPYRYNSTTAYEPDGSTTQDGSNLTDYATFCTDCHNATNTIYSTALGRDLRTIDWDNEKHGKGDADGYIKVDSPYSSSLGKVLSCLDCHEPHGSPNVTLIRKEVNGAVLADPITTITSTDCDPLYTDNNDEMKYLCTRCHNDDFEYIHHSPSNNDASYRAAMMNCSNCHESGGGMGGGGGMDEEPINCNCCHYHGSSVDDCYYSPYTRRTF